MNHGSLRILLASLMCGAPAGCGASGPSEDIIGQLAQSKQTLADMQEELDGLEEAWTRLPPCPPKSRPRPQDTALLSQITELQKSVAAQTDKIDELETELGLQSEGDPKDPEGPGAAEEPPGDG